MNKIKIYLVAAVLMLASAGAVSAQGQKTVYYNVTTDEAWPAGMAIAQGTKALDMGYKVVIFLNVRGVFLASKSYKTDTNGLLDNSLQENLKAAMDKGAQVIICPACMAKAGMTMDDVIEGVTKGSPDVTLKLMTADDTAVVSY